jgi:hypothetical protein
LGTAFAGYTAYIIRRYIDARYFLSILPVREALRRIFR